MRSMDGSSSRPNRRLAVLVGRIGGQYASGHAVASNDREAAQPGRASRLPRLHQQRVCRAWPSKRRHWIGAPGSLSHRRRNPRHRCLIPLANRAEPPALCPPWLRNPDRSHGAPLGTPPLFVYCWTGASAGVGLRGVEVPPVRAYTIQTTMTSSSAQIQTRFKLRCGAGSVMRTSCSKRKAVQLTSARKYLENKAPARGPALVL